MSGSQVSLGLIPAFQSADGKAVLLVCNVAIRWGRFGVILGVPVSRRPSR